MADIALRYFSPNTGSTPQYLDLKTGDNVPYSKVQYYEVADKQDVDEGKVQLPPAAQKKYDEVIRSEGGHNAATKSSVASERSMSNDFGYSAKPTGLGLASALAPGPIGMVAKGASLAFNANNRAAVQAARATLGLSDHANLGGFLSDNQGHVGDVNHSGETTPIAFGGIDPDGRTAFTPNEARSRMLTNPGTYAEATPQDVKDATANFKSEYPNANPSMFSRIGTALGFSSPATSQRNVNYGPSEMGPVALNGDIQSRPYVDKQNLSNTSKGIMNAMNDMESTDGRKMDVTSGFRSETHNRAVGGAEKSQHLSGNAFDVSTDGMTNDEKSAAVAHAVVAGAREIGTYKDNSLHVAALSRNPDNTGIGVTGQYNYHNITPTNQAPGWFSAGLADVGKWAGVPTPTARPNIDAAVANPNGVDGFSYAGQEYDANAAPALSKTEASLTGGPPGQTMAGEDMSRDNTPGFARAADERGTPASSPTASGADASNAFGAFGFHDFANANWSPSTATSYSPPDLSKMEARYHPETDPNSPAHSFFNKAYADARAAGLSPAQAQVAAAQASEETGFGTSVAGNNMFGIKAGAQYDGQTQNVDTHEVVNGVSKPVNDKFRAYDNPMQSFQDYQSFMAKNYPDTVTAQDVPGVISGLQTGINGPYATNPKYAQNIGSLADQFGLDAQVQYAGVVPSPRPQMAVAENPAPAPSVVGNPSDDTGYGFSSTPGATTNGATGANDSGVSHDASDSAHGDNSDSSHGGDRGDGLGGGSNSNGSTGGYGYGGGGFSSSPSSGGGFSNSSSSDNSDSGSDGHSAGYSSRSDGWN